MYLYLTLLTSSWKQNSFLFSKSFSPLQKQWAAVLEELLVIGCFGPLLETHNGNFFNFFVTILKCKMDASHDMSLADEGASAENKVGNSENVHLFFATNDLSHFLVVVSILTCQGRAK